MTRRFIGIDVGAETIKIAELSEREGRLSVARTQRREHHK